MNVNADAFSGINSISVNNVPVSGIANDLKVDSIAMNQSIYSPLQMQCPENISTYTDIDDCSADISFGLNPVISGGNVSSLTWQMTGATEENSPSSGINQINNYVFNEGVTFVRYTATDDQGSSVSCSFTVVVSDNQAPRLTAPENISIGCNDRIPSPHRTLQAFLNARGGASDNCGINPATFELVSEQKSSPVCPYTITRIYQVADWQGNTGRIRQFIFVEESEVIDSGDEEEVETFSLKSGMAIITSTGTGGNWNVGTTWVGGSVPQPGDDVVIAGGATVSLTDNEVCNSITINGTLNSSSYTLQVNEDWINNGTFNAGSGTVEFSGASAASISGTSTTVFNDFILSKGSTSNVLQVNSDVEFGGDITFTSGLLQVNSGADIICTHNAGFRIESIAGLYINGGTFTTGSFSIENNGLLQIDSGTLNIGASSGNGMLVMSSGDFVVNGGTINVAGRLEVSGGSFDMSSGTVNLNTVGHNSSTAATLDITTTSDISISGGTINFENPNGSGYYDIYIEDGGSKYITSGTINFGDGTTNILIYQLKCNVYVGFK